MMKIAINHNNKPASLKFTKEISQLINDMSKLKLDNEQPDLAISVGGDGTMLSTFHKYLDRVDHINFVGINTGHLGFYTDWLTGQLPIFLAGIPEHGMEHVSYPLLDVSVEFCGNKKPQYLTALNECMIKHSTSTLSAKVYFKNSYMENFMGDGLCISTPTGSTGYNKSLGGPVLCPSLDAMVITEDAPISNNSHRTLGSPSVLSQNEPVKIVPNSPTGNEIECDGPCKENMPIKSLTCKLSKHRIHFASYRHVPFWDRVRSSFVSEKPAHN